MTSIDQPRSPRKSPSKFRVYEEADGFDTTPKAKVNSNASLSSVTADLTNIDSVPSELHL